MGDALVGADRRAPDGALVGVGGGLLERPPPGAAGDRGAHDALRVEPVEHRPEPAALAADQALLLELDVVEEERPLLVGADVRHRDRVAREAGRVHVDQAQRRQPELAVGQAAAGDHQHGVGVLDARDVGLLAVQQQPVAAALERGGEVVGVGAGVGLGDREGDLGRARRDAAQPVLLLRRRCRGGRGSSRRSPARPRSAAATCRRAEISSPTAARPDMPSPPPPHSSGRLTPR